MNLPREQHHPGIRGPPDYGFTLGKPGKDTLGVGGEGKLRVAEKGGNEADWTEWPGEVDLYSAEIEAFLRAILGQGEPLAGGEDGLRNVEVLQAATLASAERRLVPVAEVSKG